MVKELLEVECSESSEDGAATMGRPTAAEASAPGEHRTVARVMAILELAIRNDAQGIRLGDLALAVGAPKSSVHGLAKGLVATGYLREDGGRYLVGPAASTLIAIGPNALPVMYHHVLEELSAKSGETAMLASLVGDSVVYIDSVEPKAVMRVAPPINERLTIWPRAAGKCFLAFMEDGRLSQYLRRNFQDEVEAEQVRQELEKVRSTRLAFNLGGTVAEHVGIASPIFVGDAPVNIAIVLSGPKTRMGERVVDECADLLFRTAEFVSSDFSVS
jgi:DNA-binding IclR family transcriptional regulator